jgi:hypothetical protein
MSFIINALRMRSCCLLVVLGDGLVSKVIELGKQV